MISILYFLQGLFLLAQLTGGLTEEKPAAAAKMALEGALYRGSGACKECHESAYQQWDQSLHRKMIQTAGVDSVLGDFQNRTLQWKEWRFRMFRQDGSYWIEEIFGQEAPKVFPVTYTLGSKRIQHYLSQQPDGRIRITFPTWDVLKKEWFHSAEIIPTGHHADTSVQIWNQHCYNCHVSQEQQGYDIETDSYQTTFTETGINCEMCHGPGSQHIEAMRADPEASDQRIINPEKLSPREQLLVCVQCHTPRLILANGFHPGKDYFDYYMPTLMHFHELRDHTRSSDKIEVSVDPPLWPDGRMRRFATEGAAIWQSQCYLQGNATCVSCHNPHRNTIKRDIRYRHTNILCVQCHEELRIEEAVVAHTHHSAEGEGSQCIDCHMPLTTNMMKDRTRDHTISIPVPENTLQYGIPNACNVCHEDQSAEWAVEWSDRWFPGRPKPNLRRARAFTLALRKDPAAVPHLVQLLQDENENTTIRGSAAGFLGELGGTESIDPLIRALSDPDVVVRAEAARSLSEVRSEKARKPLIERLEDSHRIVRLNATFALLKMGILKLDGKAGRLLEAGKQEYLEFLNSFPDMYSVRVDHGTYHALHENYLLALQEYRNAVKLRPDLPLAYYYLGVTYGQLGLLPSAEQHFGLALQQDPEFRNTAELLAKVRQALGQQ